MKMKWFAIARTFLVVLLGFLFCVGGLWIMLAYCAGAPSDQLVKIAEAYFLAIVALAFAIALKAAMEHAVGGVGLGGALRNIFTSSKPPDPPAGTPGATS